MTEVPHDAFVGLTDALVIEIKSLMPCRGVRSSRALARLIGESSQYVSMRLDGGNPRTGERVPLNTVDLAKIAYALNTTADSLLSAALDELSKGAVDPANTSASHARE